MDAGYWRSMTDIVTLTRSGSMGLVRAVMVWSLWALFFPTSSIKLRGPDSGEHVCLRVPPQQSDVVLDVYPPS
eukprot:413793-Amorphochlora_amoeboformis.AAC.2